MTSKPEEKNPVGAPRTYDRAKLLVALEQYIESTEIPILSEFAYKNGLYRQRLYEFPELEDALKRCVSKKEAALASKALKGEVNCTMAIFSLKQLGWKDYNSTELTGANGGPITAAVAVSPVDDAAGMQAYLQMLTPESAAQK